MILYYVLCAILVLGILFGISMMSRVETAVKGNRLSAICSAAAILITMFYYHILTDWLLWICIAIGLVIGLIWAYRIKMIQMPQVVALFNGLGGAASALVAIIVFYSGLSVGGFSRATAALALVIGVVTLVGSLIAGGKLHGILAQRPVIWTAHQAITIGSLVVSLILMVMLIAIPDMQTVLIIFCTLFSILFAIAFAIRVGGADMPITISLLNSFSGVAGSIAGMAVNDILLVAVGGVVGASGLLLTQIMCRAMNRSIRDILLGKTSVSASSQSGTDSAVAATETTSAEVTGTAKETADAAEEAASADDPVEVLRAAKDVIIIPGYGMALAQAQELVKRLADRLEENGGRVRFAIHPVAGRMPGHMNVLLAEVDVPYEQLYEMEQINDDFATCDAVVIIGANDVVNPAARSAEGTPIYGMPVLNVEQAAHVIICNYDLKPGYAGVDNPLYSRKEGVSLLLGDAAETLASLLEKLQ